MINTIKELRHVAAPEPFIAVRDQLHDLAPCRAGMTIHRSKMFYRIIYLGIHIIAGALPYHAPQQQLYIVACYHVR